MSNRQLQSKILANLIIKTTQKLDIDINSEIKESAEKGNEDNLEAFTSYLCLVLRSLKHSDSEMFDRLVYNTECQDSRDLADWWEGYNLIKIKQ